MVKLFLQRFAEGGEGAAAPAAAQAPAQSPGDTQAAAALEKLRAKLPKQQKRVEFVLPDKHAAPAQAQTPPAEAKKPTFEELVKGEYKDDFGKLTSNIIQDRLKNTKPKADAYDELTPALEVLFKKHGVEPGDVKALVNKITNDDSLYEDEALEKGIPVDTLKQMKTLEKQAEQLKQYQREQQEQQTLQAHFQKLTEQAQALKQVYPSFDLQAEMQNPDFVRLTHPTVGVDVRTAFEVVHRDQIQPAMAASIAQKTSQKLANAMQSGANRPAENGLNTSSQAVKLNDDPRTWPADVLRQIAEDTKRGKAHRF